MDRKCKNCIYSRRNLADEIDKVEARVLECHRRPPSQESSWPRVFADSWCGEFSDGTCEFCGAIAEHNHDGI